MMAYLGWLAVALAPLPIQDAPDPDERPDIALLLAPGDPETLLLDLGNFWKASGRTDFPAILAMEPGPLVLKQGLKLLPNQVPPRLSLPRLLLISNLGDLAVPVQLLAFVRRCLVEGTAVWVIGRDFPAGLGELPLDSGQTIQLVSPDVLFDKLTAFFSTPLEGEPAAEPQPPR